MDLIVKKKIKKIKVPPLYKLINYYSYLLLIVALILVNINGIRCSDNFVRTTPQPQHRSSTASPSSQQSSGSHGVENVHKMLSHAMTETINNEFGSE